MTPVTKIAIFLLMLGREKAESILAQMDNSEINAVIPEIRNLTVLSSETQERVWTAFSALGYKSDMSASDVLTLMRFLFDGCKICR